MPEPKSLLTLPFELRDAILTFAAGTGGTCNGLLRTSRQIRAEYLRHCKFPDDVSELQKLRVWIDSTYVAGGWLKLEYTWNVGASYYRVVDVIRDMDDPIAQRLMKISHVKEVDIVLQAPRRGHFVGSLLMMLVKSHDAYQLLARIGGSSSFSGLLKLSFITEDLKPGRSSKESKPFWECSAPNLLQTQVRREYFKDWQPAPFFYEYFLVNSPLKYETMPRIEYGTWPRARVSSWCPKSWTATSFGLIPSLRRLQATEWFVKLVDESHNRRDRLTACCAKKMASPDQTSNDYMDNEYHRGAAQNVIAGDFTALNSRLHFFLDSLGGPLGGPLDMLRLHRFKTMDASTVNYFGLSNSKGSIHKLGLLGAAYEINHLLRTMFNPLAPPEIRKLRSACRHLSRAAWSQNVVQQSKITMDCPRQIWQEFYPDGIRYCVNGGGLAWWRYQLGSEQDSGKEFGLWLYQWYDCMCCCEKAYHDVWRGLSSTLEKNARVRWSMQLHESPHNGVDPCWCRCKWCINLEECVMLRRESCKLYCQDYRRRGPLNTDGKCIKREYENWDLYSREDLVFWAKCSQPCHSCFVPADDDSQYGLVD